MFGYTENTIKNVRSREDKYMKHERGKCRIKVRVVNKVRLIVSISLVLLVICPAIMFAVDRPVTNWKEESFVHVYIESGDTLWAIAQKNLPVKTDIRSFVNKIKLVNNLDSALIKEGDTILVPANVKK